MAENNKTLIIVESPSKAKTIDKYLGKKYVVSSSMGHIIDLPKSRVAVDVENNFKPEYITIRGKAKILDELKKKAARASNVLLATDPDREGEAISWHLANALKVKNDNIKRIEFNEITESAIKQAISNPRDIDINLVNAQQARRILDRIVGYNISPLLWKKIKKGLSAGRVQSVALKVICEREEEIEKFIPQEYWSLDAQFTGGKKSFRGSFYSIQGERKTLKTEDDVKHIIDKVNNKNFRVQNIQKKERKRKPLPPYITSKLQQDAANRLGFTTGKTMMIAQQLYEGIEIKDEGPVGLITYIRTDSTRISDSALTGVRKFIELHYSPGYIPEKANVFTNKKNAQDAHEAIRPTDIGRTPDSVKSNLSKDQYRLYNLIWKRFVASQMTPEISEITTLFLECEDIIFKAGGSRVVFDGFTVVEKDNKTKKVDLPALENGDEVTAEEFFWDQHFTTPPPRYNDASLVKFLEDSGIGRPSTYAPTINTLINRYYIVRSGRQLQPTVLGKLVNGIMVNYFHDLVSVNFTADMEDRLDLVEESKVDWVDMLKEFYVPFKNTIDDAEHKIEEMKNILDEETDEVCEKCGKPMVKRLGKFGFFLACSGFPECRNSLPLPLGKCPVKGCDGEVVKKQSKKGKPFYSCTNYPACTFASRNEPSDKHCPKCGGILFRKKIKGRGEQLICLNEECGFQIELLDNGKESTDNDQAFRNGETDEQ